MFGLKLKKKSNFQPLEDEDRGSETQPHDHLKTSSFYCSISLVLVDF